jgi:hypothetical protein
MAQEPSREHEASWRPECANSTHHTSSVWQRPAHTARRGIRALCARQCKSVGVESGVPVAGVRLQQRHAALGRVVERAACALLLQRRRQ